MLTPSMKSPKARFLEQDPKARQFAAVAHGEPFVEVCDVAMLQFIHNQGGAMESAGADALRLQGAKLYRHTLETLADSDEPIQPKRTGLNYSQQ